MRCTAAPALGWAGPPAASARARPRHAACAAPEVLCRGEDLHVARLRKGAGAVHLVHARRGGLLGGEGGVRQPAVTPGPARRGLPPAAQAMAIQAAWRGACLAQAPPRSPSPSPVPSLSPLRPGPRAAPASSCCRRGAHTSSARCRPCPSSRCAPTPRQTASSSPAAGLGPPWRARCRCPTWLQGLGAERRGGRRGGRGSGVSGCAACTGAGKAPRVPAGRVTAARLGVRSGCVRARAARR